MASIRIEGKRIVYQRRDELTILEPWGSNCIRCRTSRNMHIKDEDWTLLPAGQDEAEVEIQENRGLISNGRLKASIQGGSNWDSGIIVWYKDGRELTRTKYEGDAATRFIHTEGDHYQIKVIMNASADERFYGLGQEQEDLFDRKGSTCSLIHYNTKSTLPVVYSSQGYGFFWNNPGAGRVELTRNHTMWVSDSAYQADYLVYAGGTPAETMKIYCELTGFAPKFPAWAAGLWQCKLRYESQEDLLAVAREYKRRSIPLDAIVIDYFHWTEQGEWKFDPILWPDPAGMVRELNEMGVRPIVSIWPTINPKSENWAEMNDRNMLVRTENGQYGVFDFYGQQTFIDPTNPATGPFVWSKVKEGYYRHGIRDFWLDEAEPEVHPQQAGNLRYYLGNGAQVGLLYPYYYTKAFWDGLKLEGEDEIILLTRAAYPGSQKYGACVWNGDIGSSFWNLKVSVKNGLSMAMAGIPWWNSDIGGFHGGNPESEEFRELLVRWFQFGVFCPVMRLHGVRVRPEGHVHRHDEVLEKSGGDNELWSFGQDVFTVLKSLVELRGRLKAYIVSEMDRTSTMGIPIMRPLFFDYPDDAICYGLEDQYLFGSDIIFAPMLEKGQVERQVYLPEGIWILTASGQEHEGGQWVKARAELHQFIAFTKKGSPVLQAFRG